MQTTISSTPRWIRGILLSVVCLMKTSGAEATWVFPAKDWAEATPESRGIDSARLKAAVADLDRGLSPEGAAELVIIRDGFLIWRGPHCDAYHQIFSCTKVFTSTVLGLLMDDGKCELADLATRHLPNLDDEHPQYARLQLRHLATMTGGYQGLVRGVSAEQPWGDLLGYLTPQSPRYEAGAACAYHDHDVFLLGNILTRLAGEPVAAVFKRRIADTIGMTQWDWGIAGVLDNGLPLNNVAGTPSRSPGIQTSARELARFGHLFLNRGLWNGQRLLSASFIEQATSTQVSASLPHASGADPAGHYGFYWWTNGRQRSGTQPWPDAPPGTYAAQGGSGNFCFVIPEWTMVVVRLGTNALTRSAKTDDLWNKFFGQVGGAMETRAHAAIPTAVRVSSRVVIKMGVRGGRAQTRVFDRAADGEVVKALPIVAGQTECPVQHVIEIAADPGAAHPGGLGRQI